MSLEFVLEPLYRNIVSNKGGIEITIIVLIKTDYDVMIETIYLKEKKLGCYQKFQKKK